MRYVKNGIVNHMEVTVSITLSKTFNIKDDSKSHLHKLVTEQVYLPSEADSFIKEYIKTKQINNAKTIAEDLSGWCVDDFSVMK